MSTAVFFLVGSVAVLLIDGFVQRRRIVGLRSQLTQVHSDFFDLTRDYDALNDRATDLATAVVMANKALNILAHPVQVVEPQSGTVKMPVEERNAQAVAEEKRRREEIQSTVDRLQGMLSRTSNGEQEHPLETAARRLETGDLAIDLIPGNPNLAIVTADTEK